MPRTRRAAVNGGTADGQGAEPDAGGASRNPVIADGMRPLVNEIARLSATLGQARSKAYVGDVAKVVDALELLQEQTALAVRFARLMVPSED